MCVLAAPQNGEGLKDNKYTDTINKEYQEDHVFNNCVCFHSFTNKYMPYGYKILTP